MFKGRKLRIMGQCLELIDRRVAGCPESGATQFANTFLEGAASTAVLVGQHDLAESMGVMLNELQACLSWAHFRQKHHY
jgi:hypothetical protein